MKVMHVKMELKQNVLQENIVHLVHRHVVIVLLENIVLLMVQVVAQIVQQVSGQMQDHQVVH